MATFRLKGHEKFQLREGWITKGLYSVSKNPKIFTGNDGTDQLGVGNNMVKSIKYWMLAMGLIGEDQRNGAELTELGKMIYRYGYYIRLLQKMLLDQQCGTYFLINVRLKNLQKKNCLQF